MDFILRTIFGIIEIIVLTSFILYSIGIRKRFISYIISSLLIAIIVIFAIPGAGAIVYYPFLFLLLSISSSVDNKKIITDIFKYALSGLFINAIVVIAWRLCEMPISDFMVIPTFSIITLEILFGLFIERGKIIAIILGSRKQRAQRH